MSNFYISYNLGLNHEGGDRTFPQIGDREEDFPDYHTTLGYFEGTYSEAARLALRKVCTFLAPFEMQTRKIILVGPPGEDIPATSIETSFELLALHTLSIMAIEHDDPSIKASKTWAGNRYQPHITFSTESARYSGIVEDQVLYVGGVNVWERTDSDAGYKVVDKVRLKGGIYEEQA